MKRRRSRNKSRIICRKYCPLLRLDCGIIGPPFPFVKLIFPDFCTAGFPVRFIKLREIKVLIVNLMTIRFDLCRQTFAQKIDYLPFFAIDRIAD
jgi:hypothetical protein